jgi:hypothetical protein
MKRRYAKKVLAIVVGVILAIFCVLNFFSVQTISTAYAQGQTATGEPAKIKELLLRQRGWDANWRGPGDAGENIFLFESRGEKIVAKITVINPPKNTSCEREVIISSDVVKLDGCRDKNITLQFDPNDQVYPFKGKSSGGFEYKLKAK